MELKKKLDSIQKKAKERTVKTQAIEYDLETLVKKIDRNIIKLNPDYQRNHRWDDQVSSRLIESLLLNIPIPLIYLSQDVDVDEEIDSDEVSRYSVIDGQQRLTAIHGFLKNNYPLIELEVLDDLNGSYYKDLPPFLTRRLEERTISCLRIDSTIDDQVKYDIFERLNSGSVKLEAQELRNATCRGPFKELIKKLAKDDNFISLSQLKSDSAKVKKMEDEELVLRFFALVYNKGYKDYKGVMSSFLTQKMQDLNKATPNQIKEMENIFKRVFVIIKNNLGDKPFAKYRKEEGGSLKKMSGFNVAVYDSIIIPLANLSEDAVINSKSLINLFNDDEYFSAVEGSVTDVAKFRQRISKTYKAIHNVDISF
jgi:uncharacterized protein with ParB-like and HNH nuclease domain